MTRTFDVFALALLFAISLTACGSGTKAPDAPAPPPTPAPSNLPPIKDVTLDQLAGTWLGTLEDTTRTGLHTVRITISGSAIAENSRDGVASNLAGSVAKDGLQLFRFQLDNPGKTDPSHGILLVDSTTTYLVFINNFFDFAVLEKGAAALPAFASSDVNGSWNGYTSTVTGDFMAPTQEVTSSTCTYPTCNGKGRASVTRAETFTQFATDLGRASGTFADSPGQTSGTARMFLSADKAFAGTWTCATVASFPDTCDFSVWRRQ
jgi:hypothetical protein